MDRRIRSVPARGYGPALLFAFLTAALPPAATAQSLSQGIIEGTVQAANGQPVGDAGVTLTNAATGQELFLITSRLGRFSSGFIPPGTYRARIDGLRFLPRIIDGIDLVAGERRDMTFVLEPGTPPSGYTPIVDHAAAGSAAADATPASSWLLGVAAAPLPFDRNALDALASLATTTGRALAPPGLPAGYTHAILNGVPLAMRARGLGLPLAPQHLPLAAFELARVPLLATDIEWFPAAGRAVAQSRSGGQANHVSAWGEWSGDALSAVSNGASFSSFRAGASIGGPIAGDTASFHLGVEYAAETTPLAEIWTDTAAVRLVETAAERYAFDLARLTRPSTHRTERASGWGRIRYQISENNALTANAVATVFPRSDGLNAELSPRRFLTRRNGSEGVASALLSSRLSDGTLNEAYVGFEFVRSTREPDPDAAADAIPGTVIAQTGLEFGSPNAIDREYRHRALHLRESMNFQGTSHLIKLGFSAQLQWYDFAYDRGLAGEFVFSSIDDFATGNGLFRQTSETPFENTVYLRRYAIFVQDRWNLAPGIEVLTGLRYALLVMPDSGAIPHSLSWQALTEIRNGAIPRRTGDFEPRFAITWTPSSRNDWLVSAGVTVDGSSLEPSDIVELMGNVSLLNGREDLDGAGDYPAPPGFSVAPLLGNTLTVIGPDFRPPRTTTIAGSIRHAIGDFSLAIAATHRNTEFLPRRRDINLLPSVVARDQHGRVIHGRLVKQGSLVAAEPQSNRRFDLFDRVWAIESAGTSTWTGLTISFERAPRNGVGIFGSYTYSNAEDDWMRTRDIAEEAQIDPFVFDPDNRDWVDGRSDLDIPHRVALGIAVQVPGPFAPSVAALFRHRSGTPFTPGFRTGVDINGDGSSRNDPAFVDDGIPGASDIIAANACLRDQQDRFAERNACRAPDVQALDARASFDLVRSETASVRLVIDALNLIASETGIIDNALYLVDPDRPLVTAANGDVDIPLLANPGFGRFLARYQPQRMLRVGLRVSH